MRDRPDADRGGREWATAYTHFLLRSSGQSVRTLQLYEQVLGCVSRGQLSPATVRESLSRFMHSRSGESATRLAKLSARFFAELTETVGDRERVAAAREEAPVDSEADSFPEFDSADPVGWFRKLSVRAERQDARSVQAFESRLGSIAAGEIRQSQVQQAVSGGYDRRFAEQLSRTARICFDLLNAAAELRSRFADDCLRSVLARIKPKGLDGDLLLRLVAPLGETTSACFSLENTRSQRAVIHCLVTDVRRADGVGPAFAPSITVSPKALRLEPEQVADVRLSLQLDVSLYDPDAAYVGAVHVIRPGEAPVEVPLLITGTAGPQAVEQAGRAGAEDSE